MNKFKVLGIILGMMTSGLSFAAKEVGNGGDAVVCRDAAGKIISAEFFDYYEARTKRGLTIDLGADNLPYDQKVELVLSRIERLNPHRAELYRGFLKTFIVETRFLAGVELVDIPDTGNAFVPIGCKLEQLAVQQEVKFPGDSRYTINLDLWNQLDANNKAGLVLHEMILREAISDENMQTSSINARYLNSIFSTKGFEQMNLKTYIDLLRLVEFSKADAQGGVPIRLMNFAVTPPQKYSVDFYDEHTVKFAQNILMDEFDLVLDGQKIRAGVFFVNNAMGMHFYPNGKLKEGALLYAKSSVRLRIDGQILQVDPIRIEYSSFDFDTVFLSIGADSQVKRVTGYIHDYQSPFFKGDLQNYDRDPENGERELIFPDGNAGAYYKTFGAWQPIKGGNIYGSASYLKLDAMLSPVALHAEISLSGPQQTSMMCVAKTLDVKFNIKSCENFKGSWLDALGRKWSVESPPFLRNESLDFDMNGYLQAFVTAQDLEGPNFRDERANTYKKIEMWPNGRILGVLYPRNSGHMLVQGRDGNWHRATGVRFDQNENILNWAP